jgi:peptidoglycan/xylan/chitin deacetylase (PgdA/CDA1 family)
MFIHQIPNIVPTLLPRLIWSKPDDDESRNVYFTFDDGPTPEITKFVLDCLEEYESKATFFCIGKNMVNHPSIVESIQNQGHRLGNHTMNHANAWKYTLTDYKDDLEACDDVFKDMGIDSVGFRPPYGRINPHIYSELTSHTDVFMWSLLTGDYNNALNPQSIIAACKKHIIPGSIIVFHDSFKAYPRLKIVLPALLAFCANHHLKPQTL